jgi:hypothetical protein
MKAFDIESGIFNEDATLKQCSNEFWSLIHSGDVKNFLSVSFSGDYAGVSIIFQYDGGASFSSRYNDLLRENAELKARFKG